MKEKMRSKRWGVFNHYVCTPGRDRHYGGVDLSDWNKTVDSFDVEKLAHTLYEIGAGYYFITLNHGSEYILAPNEAYERFLQVQKGELCSHRDLIDDIYHALSKYDIDLCLYFNCLSPFNYCYGDKYRSLLGIKLNEKPEVQRDVLTINDGEAFIKNWVDVLHEYAERYRDKVKMWWLDSCYDYSGYTDELLKYYHDAIKSGNPDALIGFNKAELLLNPGGDLKKSCKYEEVTCGENVKFDYIPKLGDIDGALAHLLIPIGADPNGFAGTSWWGARDTMYSHEFLKKYIDTVNAVGGIVTLDIRIEPDGSFDEKQIEVLKNI